jgi:hypothetical protein
MILAWAEVIGGPGCARAVLTPSASFGRFAEQWQMVWQLR